MSIFFRISIKLSLKRDQTRLYLVNFENLPKRVFEPGVRGVGPVPWQPCEGYHMTFFGFNLIFRPNGHFCEVGLTFEF